MAAPPTIVATNLTEMAKALAKSKDSELVEEFLYSLLTSSEIDEIAKRWALVKDLAKGTPQRDIAANLGLSLCKITRGSRELKKDNSPFRRMLVIAGYEVPEKFLMKRGPRGKLACD
ncbi:MAG: Trp family transcriptional regulator [Spirochaetota bacterium]